MADTNTQNTNTQDPNTEQQTIPQQTTPQVQQTGPVPGAGQASGTAPLNVSPVNPGVSGFNPGIDANRFTGSTDADNDERGAAREGEALPPPEALRVSPLQVASGDDQVVINAFYAAKPVPDAVHSIIPDAAPLGWIRDTDGDLHDASSITGLKIETDTLSGHTRHLVRAHCAQGVVSLSSHTGDRKAAETHREAVALVVSESKGLIEYADEPEPEPEEVTEEAAKMTNGKPKK